MLPKNTPPQSAVNVNCCVLLSCAEIKVFGSFTSSFVSISIIVFVFVFILLLGDARRTCGGGGDCDCRNDGDDGNGNGNGTVNVNVNNCDGDDVERIGPNFDDRSNDDEVVKEEEDGDVKDDRPVLNPNPNAYAVSHDANAMTNTVTDIVIDNVNILDDDVK